MGIVDRLPEHLKSRRTAGAITAPSAIIAGGAGLSVAILAGAPLAGVLALGALAWAVRVALALPRAAHGEAIVPKVLDLPWRNFVEEALDAQHRFRRAHAATAGGPLRDRLAEIGARLDAGVQECWRIARRGDALDAALDEADADHPRRDLERELAALPEPVRDAVTTAEAGPLASELITLAQEHGVGADRLRMVQALTAQVASWDRLGGVARDTESRLRLLDARLDEAVARAVELSLRAEDASALGGLGSDVESLVSDLESLRLGLEEVAEVGSLATPASRRVEGLAPGP